ncbi:MAG TPA: ParB/RepB/Spo0J family partition protein [Verrucomicrobiae bacterium]|jgi:ParB family chromosome partitioning protein|nr:ParB/RepB/Spo0J family partition protein [Verrucomicrobiae bacterium]
MTVRVERHSGLGRGLTSLIPQRGQHAPTTEIPLERIRPNPRQPRQRMDPTELESLAASIREHGVLQPILVTETLDGYQLVAGERRFRASQQAGLERIPAVIRQLADRDQLELALVENLQRADLGPMEEAHAYHSLATDFAMTHDQIAQRVGRAKSTITNTIRLLDLDPSVQEALLDGRLSAGHARAIGGLPIEQQARVVTSVVDQEFSVRQTEELVRRLREPRVAASPAKRTLDPDLERVEDDLRRRLGTKVTLARSRKGGRIIIEFYSDEELGQLYDRLIGGPA